MIDLQKVVIKFDNFSHVYELWEENYDTSDKLYPLSYSLSIDISRNLRILKDIAKKNYPDIYNEFTIIDKTIINRNLPDMLRSS